VFPSRPIEEGPACLTRWAVEMIATKARAKDMLTTPYVFQCADGPGDEGGAGRGQPHRWYVISALTGRAGASARQTAAGNMARIVRARNRRMGGTAGLGRQSGKILVLGAWRAGGERENAAFIMKQHRKCPRLLRRLLDGTAASGGAGRGGTGWKIQGDPGARLRRPGDREGRTLFWPFLLAK